MELLNKINGIVSAICRFSFRELPRRLFKRDNWRKKNHEKDKHRILLFWFIIHSLTASVQSVVWLAMWSSN